MEKTLARALYKQMQIDKNYTTSALYDLVKWNRTDYGLTSDNAQRIIESEMQNVVDAGYASISEEFIETIVGFNRLGYGGTYSGRSYPIRKMVKVKHYKRIK